MNKEIECRVKYHNKEHSSKVSFIFACNDESILNWAVDKFEEIRDYINCAVVIHESEFDKVENDSVALTKDGATYDLSLVKIIITPNNFRGWFLLMFNWFQEQINTKGCFLTVKEES